jgi:hypothetical protein
MGARWNLERECAGCARRNARRGKIWTACPLANAKFLFPNRSIYTIRRRRVRSRNRGELRLRLRLRARDDPPALALEDGRVLFFAKAW